MATLGPEAARIFRITHVKNVPWILKHGLHCKSSKTADPNFVPIGMADLIAKRATHTVPIKPGGSLGDYVPFYFTPKSIMMYNIKTGHGNVIKRDNSEVVVMVSSLHKLKDMAVPFIFTNGHAYMNETDYFDDLSDLDKIDWDLLRRRDFQRDPDDPGKLGRYQAEALVHRNVPVTALLGIGCYDSATKRILAADASNEGITLGVEVVTNWYF